MAQSARIRFWALGLLPAFVAGALLRGLGVRAQVLTDDELHTVGAVLAMPVGEIVRTITYEGADYCIPLSALFRFLIDHGVVFSEMTFRVPSLLAGLIALVVIPLLLAPRIGELAAVLCAWLLAISPMLVLYSRIVRPYMPVVLFAFCAVMSFDAWLRTRSRTAAGAYVLLAAGSIYLHLGSAPLVLAPFAHLAHRMIRDRNRTAKDLRDGAALLVATLFAILLPLLPAFDSLIELTQIRRDGRPPAFTTWLELGALQIGSRSALLCALATGLALYGAWVLRRREAAFVALIATITVLQLVGLFVFSPDRQQEASVLNRYLLVLLPFALALVAVALASFWSFAASARTRVAYVAGVAGFGALLLATGPLASADYSKSSFTHTPSFLRIDASPDSIPPEKVPSFYYDLYSEDDTRPIVEHPWLSQASHPFAAYQNVHRRPLLLGSLVEGYHDPRLTLANVLRPTAQEFLASRASHVVVHLDLRREASRVITADPHHSTWLKARRQVWAPLRRSGRNTAARLTREWGAPAYADESILVWDLDAVRAAQAR